jgi:hypothetical protein
MVFQGFIISYLAYSNKLVFIREASGVKRKEREKKMGEDVEASLSSYKTSHFSLLTSYYSSTDGSNNTWMVLESGSAK